MEPFVLVIFGVSGNLSQIKLLPAIYDLEAKGLLHPDTRIVGISRQPFSKADFEKYVETTLHDGSHRHHHKTDPLVISSLLKKLHYIQGDFSEGSDDLFPELKRFLDDYKPLTSNHLFYFATYPDHYAAILESLNKHDMNKSLDGWVRLMIEKPIGRDLPTAVELNKLLHRYFEENQIYRLDHYLGKETIQNILVFRFGNTLIGPLMSSEYVDHIQILAGEEFGIGSRGGYYDTVGALRDVGQNHLLQMLVVGTMEEPKQLENAEVTQKRIDILTKLKPDPNKLIFGQYNGYLYEKGVDPLSTTDTYFAFKTHIDNSRWAGVPIYVRGGKKLAMTATEISIVFKPNLKSLFGSLSPTNKPNVLTYRITPNEGIGFEILTKKPDHKFVLENSYLQYCYRDSSSKPADAYEKLLYDAIAGDGTFFNDAEEVEASWAFIDQMAVQKPNTYAYEPGTWGPDEAKILIEADGRKWIDPSEALCRI